MAAMTSRQAQDLRTKIIEWLTANLTDRKLQALFDKRTARGTKLRGEGTHEDNVYIECTLIVDGESFIDATPLNIAPFQAGL